MKPLIAFSFIILLLAVFSACRNTDTRPSSGDVPAITPEYERAIQNGFTKEELDRVKENMRTGYENQLKNKDKISNEHWASQLQNYFLEASPVRSLVDEAELVITTLA